jgi:hypothetical protein
VRVLKQVRAGFVDETVGLVIDGCGHGWLRDA